MATEKTKTGGESSEAEGTQSMSVTDWVLLGLLVAAGVAASAILVRWLLDRRSILAPEDANMNGAGVPAGAEESARAGTG